MLNLWALDVNGWANEYYSAAVRSMSESWNAFLFGTFDSSGVMTVDKPPMALWVQALSVRVFGFHPLAILVPQALMTSGDGRGGISDGRTGSRSVMAAVENSCNPVDAVSGLYDCQGEEAALAASAA